MRQIAIAGGGIIGLSIALELAARGMQVRVFERNSVMQEASWAAAGMLAAHDPENPSALASLATFSLQRYPAFLDQLRPFAGGRLLTTQTLQICHEGALAAGKALTRSDAAHRVPGIEIPGNAQALWLEEASLDPRALCIALPQAARAAGVIIHEHSSVLSARRIASGLQITTNHSVHVAGTLVVSTGCWSARHAALGTTQPSLHLLPEGSVYPRKGQMLRLRGPDGTRLTTVLRSPSVYIVPRADGTLIVGATVEDSGFDRTVREEATAWLLAEAGRLWQPLSNLAPSAIESVWTGLRPATSDHLPVIGSLDAPHGDPDVIFATGHFRNGILLAPATAACVAGMLDPPVASPGFNPVPDLSAFHPARFLHPGPGRLEQPLPAIA